MVSNTGNRPLWGNPYQWYLECFHIIQDHSQIIQLLINANISTELLFENGSIIDILYPSDTYEQRYRKMAAEAAFHKILIVWFKDGMKEDPDDMAKLCYHIFAERREIIL